MTLTEAAFMTQRWSTERGVFLGQDRHMYLGLLRKSLEDTNVRIRPGGEAGVSQDDTETTDTLLRSVG